MESLSTQLVPVFDWLLRTTLQAALLSCLILIVQLILRGRLPIRWHYCLWLLLLVRMATPWLPESKVSIFNLVPPEKFYQPLDLSKMKPFDGLGIIRQSGIGLVDIGRDIKTKALCLRSF